MSLTDTSPLVGHMIPVTFGESITNHLHCLFPALEPTTSASLPHATSFSSPPGPQKYLSHLKVYIAIILATITL